MKKVIVIAVITACFIVGLCFAADAVTPESYSSAKKESVHFLENNRDGLEKTAAELLNKGEDAIGEYNKHDYSYLSDQGFVRFDIDAQGMLGGQYWSLVYTSDGTFFGEAEKYLYEEASAESGGNNIVIAEKIDGRWWFYWIDYDGTDRSYK